MVLIDTSVWIDLLRNAPTLEAAGLARLIEKSQSVAICGIIRQEILQGLRDDLSLRRIRKFLDQTCYFDMKEPGTFDHAAEIYRNLRGEGLTLGSPADCLIAAIAIENRIPLFHKDKDFKKIASVAPLEIFKPLPGERS